MLEKEELGVGYGINIYVLSGARHIIGNVYLVVNNIRHMLNPFQILPLEDGKITLIPVAIGSTNIELHHDNVEFSYEPNEEMVKFYNETVEKVAELEAKERAKRAGIILGNDRKVVSMDFKKGA